MKKLMALFVCVMCIFGYTVAGATKSVCILSPFVDEQSMTRIATGEDFPDQICYLTIKLVYEQSDGTMVEVANRYRGIKLFSKKPTHTVLQAVCWVDMCQRGTIRN